MSNIDLRMLTFYWVLGAYLRPPLLTRQQPPAILIALIFTSPSATFKWADERMRVNVGRETFMRLAACACVNPSRSAKRIDSNSSIVTATPSRTITVLRFGRKHLSPGKHFTHLIFFGLMKSPS